MAKKYQREAAGESEQVIEKARTRGQNIIHDLARERIQLEKLNESEIALGVKNVELESESFLAKYKKSMNPKMKEQFVKDFRKSIEEIRDRGKKKHEEAVKKIVTAMDGNTWEELHHAELEISQIYQHKEDTLRSSLLEQRSADMRQIREERTAFKDKELHEFEKDLRMQNQKRLDELRRVYDRDKDQAVTELKHKLQQAFDKEANELWQQHQESQTVEMQKIREEHNQLLEKTIREMREKHAVSLDKYREQVDSRTKENTRLKCQELEQKLKEDRDRERKNLEDRNLRLAEKQERQMRDEYDGLTSTMAADLDYARKRLEESAKARLQSTRTEMKNDYKKKLHMLEEEFIIAVEKRIEDSKVEIRSHFETQKSELMSRIQGDEDRKRKLELGNLRDKMMQDIRIGCEGYRTRLAQALKVDVEKFKHRLLDEKRVKLDALEADFKEKRKVWENKMLGAAELDLSMAVEDLTKSLTIERENSVAALRSRIRSEKASHLDKLRSEHEDAKMKRLSDIKQEYLNDPDFPESQRLLELRAEFTEELDLVDRFRAFGCRIKELETDLKRARRSNRDLKRQIQQAPPPRPPPLGTPSSILPVNSPARPTNPNGRQFAHTHRSAPVSSRVWGHKSPLPLASPATSMYSRGPGFQQNDEITSDAEDDILEEARVLIEQAAMTSNRR